MREILTEGRIVSIERQSDGKVFKRHPDDLKVFKGVVKEDKKRNLEKEAALEWQRMSEIMAADDNSYNDDDQYSGTQEQVHIPVRRSNRERKRTSAISMKIL